MLPYHVTAGPGVPHALSALPANVSMLQVESGLQCNSSTERLAACFRGAAPRHRPAVACWHEHGYLLLEARCIDQFSHVIAS